MSRRNNQALSSCKKGKCGQVVENDCPQPCNPNYCYWDRYCPNTGGQGCAANCGPCMCYMIRATVTATPSVITSVGQNITLTFTIQNVGNISLCHDILICIEVFGVRSKVVIPEGDDTWLPTGSSIIVEKNYTVTAEDFVQQNPPRRSRARVFMRAEGDNFVRSKELPLSLTFGGADLAASLTQTVAGGTITATGTLSVLAGSAVAATNARLVLPYPNGVTTMTATSGNITVDNTARTITLNSATLAAGATDVFVFTYAGVAGSAYTLSGTAVSDIYDPNMANNTVLSTVVVPAAP